MYTIQLFSVFKRKRQGLVQVKSPAVQLYGRKLEVSRDVRVLDLEALFYASALEPLCRHAARRDGRPTPEGLELRLCDHSVLVHLVDTVHKQTHETGS